MKDYSFNKEFLEKNHFFFPHEVESNKFYMFHGTSSFFSDSIEKNGFNLETPILNTEHLNNILLLAHQYNSDSVIYNLTKQIKDHNNKTKTLSLGLTSGFCTKYVSFPFKGGQILSTINKLVDLLIDTEKEKTNAINITFLNYIKAHIQEIKSCSGVIYILNVQKCEEIDFEVRNDYGLIKRNIPSELIVGKMIIPNNIHLPNINPNSHTFHEKNSYYWNL